MYALVTFLVPVKDLTPEQRTEVANSLGLLARDIWHGDTKGQVYRITEVGLDNQS